MKKQGSDSLESWQANLFFEPTEFEASSHSNIYELLWIVYTNNCNEWFVQSVYIQRKEHKSFSILKMTSGPQFLLDMAH
jgi:hypothetical protein